MYKILFFLTLLLFSLPALASEHCDNVVKENINEKEKTTLVFEKQDKEHNITAQVNHENHSEEHDCNTLTCDCPNCSHCSSVNFIAHQTTIKKTDEINYHKLNYTYSIKEFLQNLSNPPPISPV